MVVFATPNPSSNRPAERSCRRGGLNAECDRTPPIDVVNGGAQFEFLGSRCNRRKQDQWIRAIGLTFPDGAETSFFDQRRQLDDSADGVVRG